MTDRASGCPESRESMADVAVPTIQDARAPSDDLVQAQQALLESEERFQKAFSSGPMPMVITDLSSSVFVEVNEQWCAYSGFRRDEAIGKPASSLRMWVDPGDRERVLAEIRQTGRIRGKSLQFRMKNGEIRDVIWSAELISMGGKDHIISLSVDVTERLSAERALLQRERSFRLFAQHSHDLIGVLDRSGHITSLVGQSARMLGYAPEALVGRVVFDLIHPESRDQIIETFAMMLREPRGLRSAVFRYAHADGSWVPIEAFATNLLDDSAVGGIVFNMRDISERVAAEQAKARLHAQLDQAMKMEAVGRLAGGVAHDFNNLLTAILGNAELAMLDIGESGPALDQLREISQAARSAAALTRKLLTFSRQQVLEPVDVDPSALIRQLENLLHRTIGEDVELSTSLDEDSGVVRIDPNQLEQIILNLAINARDAMPDGGVLSIATERVFLDASFCAAHPKVTPGPHVRISVTDNGRGIPQEARPHIFEPFFTTKPKGQGTGLGLATVFGIVDHAHGAIEVDSEEGVGTTFKIYLPCVDGISESTRPMEESRSPMRGSESIMLVEDDDMVRHLSAGLLKHLGYEVVCCANGPEALTRLRDRTVAVDLLVTDVVMPGMNGRELVRQAVAMNPGLKVLYVSGYAESVIVHHGVLEDSVAFLHKPYSLRQLAKKLREVLDPRCDFER